MVVLRFFLVLLFALPALAETGEVEQRCLDLGADCICSEPLDYNQAATEAFDPPDSEGGSSKECAGGTSVDAETGWTSVSSVEGQADLDFPNGYTGYVQRMTSQSSDGDNGWWLYGSSMSSIENETVCARYYARCDPDMPSPLPSDVRWKATQFQFDGQGLKQSQINHSGGTGWDMFGETSCSGSFSQNWVDHCKTGWIRIEHCHDIGSGSGVSLGFRVQLYDLDSDFTATRTCQTSDTYTTPVSASGAGTVAADLFIQRFGDPAWLGIDRYISHFMTARTSEDSSFWIGASSELEDISASQNSLEGSSATGAAMQ